MLDRVFDLVMDVVYVIIVLIIVWVIAMGINVIKRWFFKARIERDLDDHRTIKQFRANMGIPMDSFQKSFLRHTGFIANKREVVFFLVGCLCICAVFHAAVFWGEDLLMMFFSETTVKTIIKVIRVTYIITAILVIVYGIIWVISMIKNEVIKHGRMIIPLFVYIALLMINAIYVYDFIFNGLII